MNIVEALKIAKEQGKRVRPVGANWFVEYDNEINTCVKKQKKPNINCVSIHIEDAMSDWEVVKEKPSKQTQYKIDSMKFQIIRYCGNQKRCSTCKLFGNCINSNNESIAPILCKLDDWSLKEIIEAYHILKEAGEI